MGDGRDTGRKHQRPRNGSRSADSTCPRASAHAGDDARSRSRTACGPASGTHTRAATRTVELIRACGAWGTVLFGALLVLNGQMTPGDVLVFMAYLNDMYKPLRNLAKISTRLSRAAVSMQRLSEILDTEPETWSGESAVVATNLRGEIVFDRVSFDYGDGKEVLKDVSFTITPGQHVALVGPSGSGKSTIANLILRFYHAKQGRITIDQVNIESYERETLRREISVVIQDSLLFGASIRENIA